MGSYVRLRQSLEGNYLDFWDLQVFQCLGLHSELFLISFFIFAKQAISAVAALVIMGIGL